MDKKKGKWAGDVLSMYEKNFKGGLQSNLSCMRSNILEEYTRKWMKAVINKYVTPDPDFIADDNHLSKEKWKSLFLQILQQNKIPQSDYTIEGYNYGDNWLLGVTLNYLNHEVTIFQGRKKEFLVRFPELNPQVDCSNGDFYENYLSFTKINVIGFLNFIKYGLEELIEEICFKRDLATHLWEQYLDIDPKVRMKSFSSSNLSINKLRHSFIEDMERERKKLYPKEIPASDQIIALPTINGVDRDPDNQFIRPFIHFYHTYADSNAKLEITKDSACRGGFIVKVNDKTAYIRITDLKTDKVDYIYYEPSVINFFHTINNDMGRWVNLVLYVHLGLKHIDKMIAIYKDIFSMFEQLPTNIKMISLKPKLVVNHTEIFSPLPSIVYGPICKDDMHMRWSEDYNSYEQFYQLVADELVKRGHKINLSIKNEQIKLYKLTIEMIMDGDKIVIGVDYGDYGYKITTEYLSFVILDHQVLPLNVDWMADYIESMPPFYHEIIG